MPQYANFPFQKPGNALAPAQLDASGSLVVGAGRTSVKNVTAAAVVKATPGRVCRVNVIVAGSAAGTVNDVATTGAAAVANQVATIPNEVGSYVVDFPMAVGIVFVPGTGMTAAVSFI